MTKYEVATCPECGTQITDRGYTLECDYCLSKVID